eukprot:CAMPEP_0177690572 /NCGR_PEP_ID=MMETSP0484_2-20121128/840_1 /TAXON_ID=354590 /ORGANISM="Rhodomonas lens, Strain RHODO" /LENGTH=59 /DNA_ID=CAMNT_0019201129 /DNA_START=133 /DNA_END=312 /DNA_ORIENTATION=+
MGKHADKKMIVMPADMRFTCQGREEYVRARTGHLPNTTPPMEPMNKNQQPQLMPQYQLQ